VPYKEAALKLKDYAKENGIMLVKVDATEQASLGEKFGVKVGERRMGWGPWEGKPRRNGGRRSRILHGRFLHGPPTHLTQGYPTIKWFIDGEVAADFNGGRDTEGIVSWIKKKTGPFASDLKSAAELTAFEEESTITFVAYFKALEVRGADHAQMLHDLICMARMQCACAPTLAPTPQGCVLPARHTYTHTHSHTHAPPRQGAAFDAFKSFAMGTEDVAFATTTDAKVAKAAGLTAVDTMAVIKNEEKREVVVMKEKMTGDGAVMEFVNAEKMPLTIEFNSANSNKIFKSGISIQMIFWGTAAELKDGKSFAVLKEVAKKYKGKVVFVTTASDGADAEPITKFFGLAGKTGPVTMGFMMEKNTKVGWGLLGRLVTVRGSRAAAVRGRRSRAAERERETEQGC
jgi:protein disulfide-isomerase A1